LVGSRRKVISSEAKNRLKPVNNPSGLLSFRAVSFELGDI